MSSTFVNRWHIDLAVWGAVAGLIGALIAGGLGRRMVHRPRRSAAGQLDLSPRVDPQWLSALQTGVLAATWFLMAAWRDLVELKWAIPAGLASAVVASGCAALVPAASPDRRANGSRWQAFDRVVSTMALMAVWGVWAAVPDTEVAIFGAAAVTAWWVVDIAAIVGISKAQRPIGSIAAAALPVAVAAAVIGRAGGTSWIGAVGCGAPMLGLWVGAALDRIVRSHRPGHGTGHGAAHGAGRGVGHGAGCGVGHGAGCGVGHSAAPGSVSDRSRIPAAAGRSLMRLAAAILIGHAAMVFVSSRILSQAPAVSAALGVLGIFVLGIAAGGWFHRLASTTTQSDLQGSSYV